MRRHPPAFVENLNRALGYPGPELLPGELVRHGIIMLGDFHMVIQTGLAFLPFGILVGLQRQWLQRRAIQVLEQLSARSAQMLAGFGIQLCQFFPDSLVEFGEGKETAVPEPG